MSDINKEIDQVATQLEKSTKSPKEVLFETIRELGPAGIKAKLPTLEKAEKELLMGALTEMKKAVEMDKEYQAKYVQGKIDDTKIQEDKADDDQDEKLVMAAAATICHQGTPTPGWEGQVIKGEKMSKDKAKDKLMEMEEKEHNEKNPKKLIEAEKKEHEKKHVEKAHVGFKAVEESARKEGAEDPKAVAAAVGMKKYGKEGMEAKAHAGKMKKGEDCMDKDQMMEFKKKAKSGDKEKAKEGLKEMKKALELANPEATPELIKGEMKRLLAEESQDGDAPEMNEKTRANKENVEALDLAKDNKEAQKKVNDEKQGMKKSTPWADENSLLKAMTGGRNHHFSMEDYINEVLKDAANPKAEEMSKSVKKEDLNDIIEKGQDTTWDHLNCDRLVKANVAAQRGKIVKSFEENEIAAALGLSPEEAKKILGE